MIKFIFFSSHFSAGMSSIRLLIITRLISFSAFRDTPSHHFDEKIPQNITIQVRTKQRKRSPEYFLQLKVTDNQNL
jgi:hypothetical protein